MPKELDDCVKALVRQGYSESAAWAICVNQHKKRNVKQNKDSKDNDKE